MDILVVKQNDKIIIGYNGKKLVIPMTDKLNKLTTQEIKELFLKERKLLG